MVPSPAEASDALTVPQAVRVCVRWFRSAPRGFALVAVDSESERREFTQRLRESVEGEGVAFADLVQVTSPQELVDAMIARMESERAVVFGGLGQGFKASTENVHVLNVNRERLAAVSARQLWVVTPALRRALQETAFDLYSWFMPNLRVVRSDDLAPVILEPSPDRSAPSGDGLRLSPALAGNQAEALGRRFRNSLLHAGKSIAWPLLAQALSSLTRVDLYRDADRLLTESISLISDRFRVPEDRWETVVPSVDLLVVAAEIRMELGAGAEGEGLYRQALRLLDGEAEVGADRQDETWRKLTKGRVLSRLARWKGDSRLARMAVDELESLLARTDRGRDPETWTQISGRLGVAYAELAEFTGEREAVFKSLEHFQSELEGLSKDSSPEKWAMTQCMLGLALYQLGLNGNDEVALEKAIAAFEESLTVWTQASAPANWVVAMNNLGNAYRLLGRIRGERDLLLKAKSMLSASLDVWSREQAPANWASLRNNYAGTLLTLNDGSSVRQAVEIYEDLQRTWTEEEAPFDWAKLQTNLALGHLSLAQSFQDPNELVKADDYIQRAMTVFASLGDTADLRKAGGILNRIHELAESWPSAGSPSSESPDHDSDSDSTGAY